MNIPVRATHMHTRLSHMHGAAADANFTHNTAHMDT